MQFWANICLSQTKRWFNEQRFGAKEGVDLVQYMKYKNSGKDAEKVE